MGNLYKASKGRNVDWKLQASPRLNTYGYSSMPRDRWHCCRCSRSVAAVFFLSSTEPARNIKLDQVEPLMYCVLNKCHADDRGRMEPPVVRIIF